MHTWRSPRDAHRARKETETQPAGLVGFPFDSSFLALELHSACLGSQAGKSVRAVQVTPQPHKSTSSRSECTKIYPEILRVSRFGILRFASAIPRLTIPLSSPREVSKKILMDDHRQLGTGGVGYTTDDLPDLLPLDIQFPREGACIVKGSFNTPVFIHGSGDPYPLVFEFSPQNTLWDAGVIWIRPEARPPAGNRWRSLESGYGKYRREPQNDCVLEHKASQEPGIFCDTIHSSLDTEC